MHIMKMEKNLKKTQFNDSLDKIVSHLKNNIEANKFDF